MTITPAEQVGQAALSGFAQYESQIAELKRQLAESQAREARLLETMQQEINYHFMQAGPKDLPNIKQALALPHDNTALKEYRDGVIEDCIATTNQVLDGLEDADNVVDALREMKGK